jgi:hypothetical protein
MADKKISELTGAGTLTGTEEVPIVQGGITVKATTQDIADLGGGGTAEWIIVTSDITAQYDNYYSIGNDTGIEITSPTPTVARGYVVYSVNGDFLIDGFNFTSNNLVYVFYNGATWTYNIITSGGGSFDPTVDVIGLMDALSNEPISTDDSVTIFANKTQGQIEGLLQRNPFQITQKFNLAPFPPDGWESLIIEPIWDGSKVVFDVENMDLRTPTVNNPLEVSFDLWRETFDSIPDVIFLFQVSTNGGGSFTTIETYTDVELTTSSQTFTVDLSAYSDSYSLIFRFRKDDGTINAVYLDNFNLKYELPISELEKSNYKYGINYFNHFYGLGSNDTGQSINDTLLNLNTSGAGSSAIPIRSTTNPTQITSSNIGVLECLTGTTTTGFAGAFIGFSTGSIPVGVGRLEHNALIVCPTLSTGTERYLVFSGLFNTRTNNAGDCIAFVYDEGGVAGTTNNTASPNWQVVTINNSTRTITDTGVAVSATTFQKLSFIVNGNGTSVQFFINNSLVATHTTNIPTGQTKKLSLQSYIVKTAGTTTRNIYLDYVHIDLKLTTPLT